MDIEEDKLLMREIAKNQKEIKKHRRISFIIAGMVVLLGFLPLVISGFIKGWDSKLDTNFEMSIFLPAALAIISSMIILLVTNAKRDVKITRIFKCEQLLRKERAFNPEFTTIEGDFYTQMTADEMYKTLYAEWEKNEIFVETLKKRPNEKTDWILGLMTVLNKQRDEEKKKQEEKPKKKRKKKTVEEAAPLDMETVKKELKAELEAEQAKIEEEMKKREDKDRLRRYISANKAKTWLNIIESVFICALVVCVIFIPWGNVSGVDISLYNCLFSSEGQEALRALGEYSQGAAGLVFSGIAIIGFSVLGLAIAVIIGLVALIIFVVVRIVGLIALHKEGVKGKFKRVYYLKDAPEAISQNRQKSTSSWRLLIGGLFANVMVLVGAVIVPLGYMFGYGMWMNVYIGGLIPFCLLLFLYIIFIFIQSGFIISHKEDLQNAEMLLDFDYEVEEQE